MTAYKANQNKTPLALRFGLDRFLELFITCFTNLKERNKTRLENVTIMLMTFKMFKYV